MAEGVSQVNVASMLEDFLGKRLSDMDLATRKAQEASLRRYEASGWLRKMVGVVAGKDLPAEPSEKDFRLGLRSGIILCNVLNKVQPGAVAKVVEAPSDAVVIPDGAAHSAYQYFENVRNFLVAIEEMGIPTFEASDLEQGGKSSRIVNCVLALKSYNEWKESGGSGQWKFGGSAKSSSAGKQFVKKNTDLFINSLTRMSSAGDKSLDSLSSDDFAQELNDMGTSSSLHGLFRELLSDRNQEDIPVIVEQMLSKVMEDFQRRLASKNEQKGTALKDTRVHNTYEPGEIETSNVLKDESLSSKDFTYDEPKGHLSKHQHLVEHQKRSIQELKITLLSAKEDMQMLRTKYQEQVEDLSKHVNGLAHAASGYQRVLEENRKLYNQVQDLKGNIRVYCRVRPFLPGQPNGLSTVEGIYDTTITLTTPAKNGKGKKSFTFNKVFGPSATQEEVFSDTQPLIRSVLDGYNICIFAYGQTGSGKTYTMTGPGELTKESLGVNYRALSDLFLISEQRKDTIAYDISCQMIEIYNEQVRDLLVTDGVNKKLEIRNNSSNGINVPNANLVPVTSTSDVINLMNLGHKNRAVGSTSMNDRSSRSHSCLTVHVQGRDLTSGAVLRGCMHLVDLAGSERADKTEAVGDRLKEAQHINRSLSALGDVISSLAQKLSHVPYRNSKLTQLLQDSLGGQAKTLMFVHISPEPDALGETISTLKFAERVSTIELGAARANKESADVKELKEQIANLKAVLAQKEGGDSGLFKHYESSNSDRQNFRSYGSSPSHSSRISTTDASKTELSTSPTEEERANDDWVDKEANALGVDNLSEDGRLSPTSLNKISMRSRQHRQHSLDNGLARTKYEAIVTNNLDELEVVTSDSLELDYKWQLSNPKSKNMPNGVGSKLRRPCPKLTKRLEPRSQIPQPTKRVSNARQVPNADGRRKPASGK